MGAADGAALPSGRVALLFSDIEGSTALLNRLGDAYGEVLDQHDRIIRAAFARHGGHEFSNEGDAFGAAFGDPAAAARAALEVQRELDGADWPGGERVRVRMGLHYGEPRLRGADYWGEDVHFAARVCSAAHGGQVIISAATRAALANHDVLSLGNHGLKDFPTPRELFQLVAVGAEPEQFPPPKTLSTFRSNLPSISTPLIGREHVLADVAGLFADCHRLVTLTGAGGMGKTRVALALGERLGAHYPDGVAFVPLSAVDGIGAAAAVAEATGTPRGGDVAIALLEHLARRRMLIILDNCEHLADAAAALSMRILDRCPQVAILATAQLPLDLASETVYRLPPLVTGVEMFVDRARARDRSFRVNDAERDKVEELCALLEGSPLAIELAAARVRLLGLDRLLELLQRDVEALGGGGRDLPERHRSLRAALDWTLGILTPEVRDVFIGFGAFAMSWSLEEAEQLFAEKLDELAVWEALTRLMDASLVVVRGDGRFAMPQRVRQHAADLLDASALGDHYRGRHAELIGRELHELALDAFVDYRRQLANIVDLLPEARRALSWSREQPSVTRRHVVGLLAPALSRTGNLALVVDDLADFPPPPLDPRTYDDTTHCFALGLVHAMRWSTDTDAEVGLFDRAVRGFTDHGDPREVVYSHYMADNAECVGTPEIGSRPERLDAMSAAAALVPDPRWQAEVARCRALQMSFEPDSAILHQVVATLGMGTGCFSIEHHGNQAHAACLRGDLAVSAYWFARTLRETSRQQLYLVLNNVKAFCWMLAVRNEDELCCELRAAINKIYRTRTGSDHGDLYPQWGPAFAESEARLPPERAVTARARGAAMSYDELVDRAIALADRLASPTVGDGA